MRRLFTWLKTKGVTSIVTAERGTGGLRLYVAGETPRSVAAIANLKKICEEHLAGKYSIEIIDLLERPQSAQGEQIVAIPTLERRLPEPVREIIGDLSNTERVLIGLDLRPGRVTCGSPSIARRPVRAEGVGFEPTGLAPTRFQDETIRPLSHPSQGSSG